MLAIGFRDRLNVTLPWRAPLQLPEGAQVGDQIHLATLNDLWRPLTLL
jgi:hypothetical protein